MFRKEPRQLLIDTLAPIQAADYDFDAYINRLDALGKFLHLRFQQSKQSDKLVWLEEFINSNFLHDLTLDNPSAFHAFEIAWRDPHLENDPDKHQLHAKTNLNRSTRRNINLAMRALALCIHETAPLTNLEHEPARELDESACTAIQSYKTPLQRRLKRISNIAAIILSITAGLTSTATVVLMIAAWPVGLIIVSAILTFVTMGYINWLSFSNIIPTMLNDILGKDHFFEGWLNYHDSKTGTVSKLPLWRRILLPIVALLTILASITAGVITFSFLTQLATLPFIPAAAKAILDIIIVPISATIASIFSLGSVTLIFKPVLDLIKTDHLPNMLFATIKDIFDPTHEKNLGKSRLRLNIEKGVAYGILGIASAVYFGISFIIQLRCSASLSAIFKGVSVLSAAITSGVVFVISATAMLTRLPAIFTSCKNIIASTFSAYRNIFRKKPNTNEARATTGSILVAIKETFAVEEPKARVKAAAKTARIAQLRQPSTHQLNGKQPHYRLFTPAASKENMPPVTLPRRRSVTRASE